MATVTAGEMSMSEGYLSPSIRHQSLKLASAVLAVCAEIRGALEFQEVC